MTQVTRSGAVAGYAALTAMDQGPPSMNLTQLISKLIEIGRAARQDAPIVHPLVIEAQDYALAVQREILTLLQENQQLRASSLR